MGRPSLVFRHEPTGLVLAVLPSLPGFYVHAHSMQELESKLPAAEARFREQLSRIEPSAKAENLAPGER